jgi:hypothetical protein
MYHKHSLGTFVVFANVQQIIIPCMCFMAFLCLYFCFGRNEYTKS